MSEILNEAAIKVTLDASGVEEGAARIERVAAKTGKTLDSLGGGAAFKNVGEGAGAAAGQIDKATATMAAAIQRTTAAMSAGAKGTAEYYAALASSRGLNTSALRPYLDQLDAVTKKTAAAAEAQRQLETSTRFLDGLRSQADGIGKTASQLAALRAEQLGVTESARPFIEQLREAEEASAGATNSLGGLAQAVAAIGLGGGIAAVAQLSDEYGKYVSQLKLATNGQTEFANAQVSVRRIATSAQSDLSATASLYSSITKGTQELGIAQRQVADITETVSLALKVSGASGAEASSAILQLSQAFASGVLRGDEFNSVNEAAPRLMQALADGIGVPTGALRKMAEEGELTTAILADALPRALATLRDEAKSVETIGGAYTVLKNNILELVGATAQSNGVVAALSGGINLLAENLTLAAGAVTTFVGVKLGTALAATTREAYASVAANQARLASNIAAARADVAATASASALATARVAELRASVLAAEGAVALAIATNGLVPAQARAAAASAAHTAALSAQTAAMGAASIAGRAASGAMALLGGPVGAVIGLLGIAATAWAVWGDSASKAEAKVSESTIASTEEVLEGLDKQIAKLRERNRLASMGFKPADVQSPGGEKLAEVVGQIDRAGKGEGEYANLNLSARTEILKVLGKQYGDLTSKIAEFNRESETDAGNKSAKSAGEWMSKYATNAEKLSVELAKAKKELGSAFTPELEARIAKQFEERNNGAAKEISAYKSLSEAINERVAATAREATSLAPLTEAQKLQARIDGEVASGKLKLTAAQKASLEARLGEISANEEIVASQKRAAQGLADFLKIQKEYDDGVQRTIDNAIKEAERNEELARTFGMTKAAIETEELARLQNQMSQRVSLGLTLKEIEDLEKLIDAKKRNASALASIEAQDATKKAAEKATQEWERAAESIEQSLTDALLRGFESGKSFGKNLIDTLKNMFNTLVLRPIIQAVVNPVAANIASAFQGGSAGGSAGSVMNLLSAGKTIYSGFSSGLSTSMGGMVTQFGNMFGSQAVSAFGNGLSGSAAAASKALGAPMTGAASAGSSAAFAIPIVGWIAAGAALSRSLYKQGWDMNNGTVKDPLKLGSSFDALDSVFRKIGLSNSVAAMLSGQSTFARLFGRKNPEIESQGFQGTIGTGGFDGQAYANILEKGGVFRSDKRYTQTAALGAEQDAGLDATVKAMIDAAKGFASTLGIEASVIEGYNKTIKLQLGTDEAKNQEAIAKLFGEVGDELSVRLVPSLVNFAAAGESASATLQRLVGDYSLVDAVLTSLSMTMGAVGVTSLGARERLITNAGGAESFAANSAGFAQNFLTEDQRNAPVLKAVREQLDALGLSAVDTRDEFRDVLQALNLTNEAESERFGKLLQLQGAFAQVYPAMEDTAAAAKAAADALEQTNKGYRDQIVELRKALMSPGELYKFETADMDSTTKALYDLRAALQAEVSALDLAKTKQQEVTAQRLALQDEYDTLTMNSVQLEKKRSDAIDATNKPLYDQIQAVKLQKSAAEEAAQAMKAAADSAAAYVRSMGDALSGAIERATAAAKALREFNDSLLLGNLSALDPDARYREAKKQFESSSGEDTQAAQAFLQASKDRGADDFYYQRDFAAVQAKLADAIKAADARPAALAGLYQSMAGWLSPAITPAITPVAAPPVVQSGSMSRSSASQDVSRVEAKVDRLIESLGGAMENVASSTSKTAEILDRVSNNGAGLILEGA